jgi:hypothetical protein
MSISEAAARSGTESNMTRKTSASAASFTGCRRMSSQHVSTAANLWTCSQWEGRDALAKIGRRPCVGHLMRVSGAKKGEQSGWLCSKKSTWYTSHEILGLKHHSSAYMASIQHLWMPCMRCKPGLSTLRHAHQVSTPIIRSA